MYEYGYKKTRNLHDDNVKPRYAVARQLHGGKGNKGGRKRSLRAET
jgi:hypothetical protein